MVSDMCNKWFWMFIAVGILGSGCTGPSIQDDGQVYRLYYSTGVLKSVWESENGLLNGMKREYSVEGTLKSATEYKDDMMHGRRNLYHPDGSLWVQEIYEDGVLLKKKTYDGQGILTNEEHITD